MYKMGINGKARFMELFVIKTVLFSPLIPVLLYLLEMITHLDYYTKEISFYVPGVYLYHQEKNAPQTLWCVLVANKKRPPHPIRTGRFT